MNANFYQANNEKKVAAVGLTASPGGGRTKGSVVWLYMMLRKHLPPHHQLTHTILCTKCQQTVMLAVQTHFQQVLLRKVVCNQITLVKKHNILKKCLGYMINYMDHFTRADRN